MKKKEVHTDLVEVDGGSGVQHLDTPLELRQVHRHGDGAAEANVCGAAVEQLQQHVAATNIYKSVLEILCSLGIIENSRKKITKK